MVGVLAGVLGVLSFIVQPIEYLVTGQTSVLGFWAIAVAFTISGTGTVLIVRLNALPSRPSRRLFRVGRLLAPIALGLTVGLALPLALRPVEPAPPTVLYRTCSEIVSQPTS